ncbi:CPBP family intramembrane glutamic endopeptidase [Chloroflexota bacterium]
MDIINQPNLGLTLTRGVIILLTLFLTWVTYQSNSLLQKFQPDFNLLLSPPELVVRIILVGGCLLLAWLMGLPAEQLGLAIADPLGHIGVGLVAGIVILAVVNLLTFGAIRYFGRDIYSPWVIRNILPRRPLEWVLVPLALAPAVAMEELLFRTLWLGGFSDIIPLPVLILGTSVVFGIMHLPQGFLGVIVAGGVNVLLSLLFLETGGILAPLVAHYVINLLQVLLAHYQRDWLENY